MKSDSEQVNVILSNHKVVCLSWNGRNKSLHFELWTLANQDGRSYVLESEGSIGNHDGALEEFLNPLVRCWADLHPGREVPQG